MAAQAFSIPQFLETFQVGRTKAYEEIASGRLATYKVGRRRFISSHAAAEWQRKLEAESAPQEPAKQPEAARASVAHEGTPAAGLDEREETAQHDGPPSHGRPRRARKEIEAQ